MRDPAEVIAKVWRFRKPAIAGDYQEMMDGNEPSFLNSDNMGITDGDDDWMADLLNVMGLPGLWI